MPSIKVFTLSFDGKLVRVRFNVDPTNTILVFFEEIKARYSIKELKLPETTEVVEADLSEVTAKVKKMSQMSRILVVTGFRPGTNGTLLYVTFSEYVKKVSGKNSVTIPVWACRLKGYDDPILLDSDTINSYIVVYPTEKMAQETIKTLDREDLEVVQLKMDLNAPTLIASPTGKLYVSRVCVEINYEDEIYVLKDALSYIADMNKN